MNRTVRFLYNNGKSLENVHVFIERNRQVAYFIRRSAQFLDTVEYNDGSFLDVYYDNGVFVGLEYDANCKFVS